MVMFRGDVISTQRSPVPVQCRGTDKFGLTKMLTIALVAGGNSDQTVVILLHDSNDGNRARRHPTGIVIKLERISYQGCALPCHLKVGLEHVRVVTCKPDLDQLLFSPLQGRETKASLNNSGRKFKRSKLERRLNKDIGWCVLILAVVCITCTVGKTYHTLSHSCVIFE